MNTNYKIGECHYLSIISITNVIDDKGFSTNVIIVKDSLGNIISLNGFKWQNKENWNFDSLKCEIIGEDSKGIPILKNVDFRHPFYEINKIYSFKIIGSKVKKNKNVKLNVFQLEGKDGCIHEVSMFPGQKFENFKGSYINCVVNNITNYINLSQKNSNDFYFKHFEEIVIDLELKKKYFSCFFEVDNFDNIEDFEHIHKFKQQYESQQSFWVFTYVNHVLKRLFEKQISNFNYKSAIEINNIIILIQDWILKKGIITSIKDKHIKNDTEIKSKYQLKHANLRNEILYLINKYPYEFLNHIDFTNDCKLSLEKLFLVIQFSNLGIIDMNLFHFTLDSLISKDKENGNLYYYYWSNILKLISLRKNHFFNDIDEDNFSLISRKQTSDFSQNEIKFLFWSYLELLIAEHINFVDHFNLTTGIMLKLFIKSNVNIIIKEQILYNSYCYFDCFTSIKINNIFIYNKSKIELSDNIDKLEYINQSLIPMNSSDDLNNLYLENKLFDVQLTSKYDKGYEVQFEKAKGFLPLYNIKNKLIKSSVFDFKNNYVKGNCVSYSKFFNFFIFKQDDSIIDIIGIDNPIVGNVYDGIVKNIVDYGVFISTRFGDGLIHTKDLNSIKKEKFDQYFFIGSKIRIVFLGSDKNKRLGFSFDKLKLFDPDYYLNFIDKQNKVISNQYDSFLTLDQVSTQRSLLSKSILYKASCIELYAALQNDIGNKIENLKIAQQIYSSEKSARSYLLNIYLSYFEILSNIDSIIKNKNYEHIDIVRKNVIKIKNDLNKKTISIFPDSEKIIFFLDILSLFNLIDSKSIDLLYNFVIKYSKSDDHKELRTITKITLANNLLLSETNLDVDFVFKNYRLIFDYISEGVFSLKETTEDVLLRELERDRLYYKNRISEDESETLEFKSTFFTPVNLDSPNLTSNKNKNIPKNNLSNISKNLIHSALKTLVAFANSNGGSLLIGVNNDKKITGIDCEYNSSIRSLKPANRDGYGQYFDEIIRTYIGDSFSSLLERKFLKFPEGDILIVDVKKSQNEIFLLKDKDGNNSEQFYIRNLVSSKELKGYELTKYLKNRF